MRNRTSFLFLAFFLVSGPVGLVVVLSMALTAHAEEPRFQHHYGDRDLGGDAWGQTDLVDVDQDGDLDFITGQRGGEIIWFEYRAATDWVRHTLGEQSPSDVGGAALDVNGDGWPDFVTGGVWYENPGNPREGKFHRHVFDSQVTKIHDLLIGDIDGDGQKEVITMSDANDLRWYKISKDPTQAWEPVTIGESVHSGISLGDLDADGDLDVVRSNIWFENLGNGQRWTSHQMTVPWGGTAEPWQKNATQTQVADINDDGRLDVVIADGENPGARIAWLQGPVDPKKGRWVTHFLPYGDGVNHDTVSRGAYHTLQVGDFTGDGKPDVFAAEMEAMPGDAPPRWFLWENNPAGTGVGTFRERVILDINLGAHEAVAADVDSDGDLDICSKLWRPAEQNGNHGRNHFDYLENLAK